MDQQPLPLASQILPEKHRSKAKRNHRLLMQDLVKEHQQASKAAPSPTVPPNSFSTRLATFTSWPHSNPSASVMAKAGFRQVHGSKDHDRVECSECNFPLADWKPHYDPTLEHARGTGYSCFRPSEPVVFEYKASAPTEKITMSTNSVKSPHTSMTATTTAVEMPISTKKKSPSGKYCLVSAGRRDVLGKLLDKKANDAPAKTDVLPSSMEDVALDSEDWVDLGFDGEEKDGWIEV